MLGRNRQPWVRGLPVLGLIWLVGAIGDRLWFALDHSMPTWDQAEYLTGALNYWRALQAPHWFDANWWTGLWQLSSKIPPLVYITTAPFLSAFGAGPDQSTLINLLFSVILLGSVYALGICLFTVAVGLWAAGLCLLMPGLYRVRLDFLLDYPLAALVTLSFACLTLWRQSRHWLPPTPDRAPTQADPVTGAAVPLADGLPFMGSLLCGVALPMPIATLPWLLAGSFGLSLGLALFTKQPALLFLLVPTLWVAVETLWRREWLRLAQLLLAGCLSAVIWLPWYRTNWLIVLTASKRATIDSAIAEGDPSLRSLAAWTYYLKDLPDLVSWPLLLVPLIGFLCFWRRARVSCQWLGDVDYAPKTKAFRQQLYAASRQALGWLLLFWLGGYLLSSLNINKDDRYIVPTLPTIAVIAAYGVTLLPRRWKLVSWGMVGLATVLMMGHTLPLSLKAQTVPQQTGAQHIAYVGPEFPHAQVVDTVIQAEPYLRSTIGVLPSTGVVNQHNINYFGNLRNFQVYGRQVGARRASVSADQRSLSWFVTKTGEQGSIRKPDAQTAMAQAVEQGGDFQLQQSWTLPDRSLLQLFRRRIPLLEVGPIVGPTPSTAAPIRLEQIILPEQAPPGQPMPVTYRWSGSWSALQRGLVILTWRAQGKPKASDQWFHDHGIGLGLMHPIAPTTGAQTPFQVVERLAMLPPRSLANGTYTLDAVYVDRQTGKTTAIAVPPISLQIVAGAQPTPAPELDLVTQLRTLAAALPKGGKALDAVFDEIGRINQYDPTQDYVDQTRQATAYRLAQSPGRADLAYTLALANVLKRRVNDAIVALNQVVQLDTHNPYAYAYLAFVNLYDFHPGAAQAALETAQKLNATIPELQLLHGVSDLMQGKLLPAWRSLQAYQAHAKAKS